MRREYLVRREEDENKTGIMPPAMLFKSTKHPATHIVSDLEIEQVPSRYIRHSIQSASASARYCVFFCVETDFLGRIWASTTNR